MFHFVDHSQIVDLTLAEKNLNIHVKSYFSPGKGMKFTFQICVGPCFIM